MFKFNFLFLNNVSSKEEVNMLVSRQIEKDYGIPTTAVLKKIQAREALGSVQVSKNFDLPHIEYDGKNQGVFLTNYFLQKNLYSSLFLIVNPQEINKELEKFLKNILNETGLESLRRCKNLNEFKKIIEGV
ncbi:PTS sugar transporter subunit IIA [Companilactobacillus sp. HBUAS56257]|uniref:PTS sugar transporter subunit IIA n=1 Tax=Companilactobacillus sp. HBUAS56257 TaxID=3109360 RepID=UPI002FF0AD68